MAYSNIRDFTMSGRLSGWMREQTKPAKSFLNDGISNTDVRKSRNDEDETDSCSTEEGPRKQLGPGIYHPTEESDSIKNLSNVVDNQWIHEQANLPSKLLNEGPPAVSDDEASTEEGSSSTEEGHAHAEAESPATIPEAPAVSYEDTLLIFDWDDTVLPSSWVQSQGLRLDESSEVLSYHRQQLFQVAKAASETLRLAKQLGTVVIITNAERGWIELSCQKFLPTLYPALESVKVLSARTTYESSSLSSPLEWKVRAFAAEIERVYGKEGLQQAHRRKNVLSLGDSVHEREALLRATMNLPGCWSKSLKFVERPDVAKICHQHALVCSYFERLVQYEANLDYSIRC